MTQQHIEHRPHFHNISDLIRQRLHSHDEHVLFRFLPDNDHGGGSSGSGNNDTVDGVLEWTYGAFDHMARALAVDIARHAQPGDRALVIAPTSADFVLSFFGCLYAGVVAVPVYPPSEARRASSLDRMQAIFADCEARLIVSTSGLIAAFAEVDELRGARTIASDALDMRAAASWTAPALDRTSAAMFQYTSGSTGSPKGVMLSHGNLLRNEEMFQAGYRLQHGCRVVCWIPLFHDLGLSLLLAAPFNGGSATVMSPAAFIKRPARWLEAISRYRGQFSGAPNFAYDLCTTRVSADEAANLDLSSWHSSVNAAEPVRDQTQRRFAERFAPMGLAPSVVMPAYGLAEATALVTACADEAPVRATISRTALMEDRVVYVADTNADNGADNSADNDTDSAADGQLFVSSGRAVLDTQVHIVDPETHTLCSPDQVGEIWISGAQVGAGYWKKPDLTAATFAAQILGAEISPTDTAEGNASGGRKPVAGRQTFLRTGDLGFMRDGELFVTGRRKDVIIIRGRNHYPQDIEFSVDGCHRDIRPGCSAAFSVDTDRGETLIIVAEIRDKGGPSARPDIADAIRQAVVREHELRTSAVALIPARAISKTSSGKIQRRACRAKFLQRAFDELWRSEWPVREPIDSTTQNQVEAPEQDHDAVLRPATNARVLGQLREELMAEYGCATSTLHPDADFASIGLDSHELVALAGSIESRYGVPLAPTAFFDYPTLAALAGHIETLRKQVAAPSRPHPAPASGDEAIAIVGVGCRLPGGVRSLDTLWRLLDDGVEAISEVPHDRWDPGAIAAALMSTTADATAATAPSVGGLYYGGFLPEVDRFDAGFFGVSAREAADMDPQQRLLLEVSWEALEHAGQPADELRGSRTGVFAGVAASDYAARSVYAGQIGAITPHSVTGNVASVAAGRLSYSLGLSGPSMAVDTACSSSLVALHLACDSIRNGDSDLALACGVNVNLSPANQIFFTRLGALADDGHCKAFDARADGYVRSEGCAVVVLKRLSDAVRDGDRVLAVVRGSSVNQDGRSNGLTAPSGAAQAQCLRTACERAQVRAAEVDYVEAHGTGTKLGDPIELKGLAEVYGNGRPQDRPLRVGSVKAHIGHTEAAAGLAGLLKVLAMLQQQTVPRQINFSQPNPLVPWGAVPLDIPTAHIPWTATGGRRLAGVSSFGISGTNAHVIIEEAPRPPRHSADAAEVATIGSSTTNAVIVPISARDPQSLQDLARAYADRLAQSPAPDLGDVAYSAATRRSHHGFRAAAIGQSHGELIAQLGLIAGQKREEVTPPQIAFVFPGQGSQWAGMGRGLAVYPAFRNAIDACARAFAPFVGWSLTEMLSAPADDARWNRIDVIQPVLFAMEVALAALWRSFEVAPDLVIGHSMGEVAAFHIAGALGLEDAASIICQRSRLLRGHSGKGAMALLEIPFAEADAWIGADAETVSIAVCNSPRSVVVSGDGGAIEGILARAAAQDIFARPIKVDVASHSPQMDAVRGPLTELLRGLRPTAGSVPMYSTVDDCFINGAGCDAGYWVRNLRQPVRFAQAVQAASSIDRTVFIEISPHPILGPAIGETLNECGGKGTWVPSLKRDSVNHALALKQSAAMLYEAGGSLNWDKLAPAGKLIDLPAYPFRRERHWIDTRMADPNMGQWAAPAADGPQTRTAHPLLGSMTQSSLDPDAAVWRLNLDCAQVPYLADHCVDNTAVLPAAGYIEMVFAACREAYGQIPAELFDIALLKPIVLSTGAAADVQLDLRRLDDELVRFQFASHTAPGDAWTIHAKGLARYRQRARSHADHGRQAEMPHHDWAEQGERDTAEVYAAFDRRKLAYRGAFRGLRTAWAQPGKARGLVGGNGDRGYDYHPATLDACLQVLALAQMAEGDDLGPAVPTHIERVVRVAPLPADGASASTPIRVNAWIAQGTTGSLHICGDDGRLLMAIEGIETTELNVPASDRARAQALSSPAQDQAQPMLEVVWRDQPLVSDHEASQGREPGSGDWLLLGPPTWTDDLERALRARGCDASAYAAHSLSPEALYARVRNHFAKPAQRRPCVGVVFVQPAASPDQEPHRQPQMAVARLSALVGALVSLEREHLVDATPPLWVVTERGVDAGINNAGINNAGINNADANDADANLSAAGVWSYAAVIGHEHPELCCTRVDVGGVDDMERLADELLHQRPAGSRLGAHTDQIAYRHDRRRVAQLRRTKRPVGGSPLALQPDAAYVITGGFGGLGAEAARHLVDRGARHLLLLSRGGAHTAERMALVAELQGKGARVRHPAIDVGRRDELAAALDTVAQDTPIRGIIHTAGFLDDATIAGNTRDQTPNQTAAQFERVFAGKVHGAVHLHELTRDCPLDFFVLYSSFAALLGSPGQGAYAAANACLDALARHRRQRGYPALSIQWGPIADVGLAASHGRAERMAQRGVGTITAARSLAIVETLLATGSTVAAPVDFELARWQAVYPHSAQSAFFASLGHRPAPPPATATPTSAPHAQLTALQAPIDRARAVAIVEDIVRTEVSAIVGMAPERISRVRALQELGVDSLMAVELRNRLEGALGLRLSTTLIWRYPTLRDLSGYLADSLAADAAKEPTKHPGMSESHDGDEPGRSGPSDEQASQRSDAELMDELRREMM